VSVCAGESLKLACLVFLPTRCLDTRGGVEAEK
jgi:hypothetical protein